MSNMVRLLKGMWKGFIWLFVMLAKLDRENRRHG